jgi:hypothetical protein
LGSPLERSHILSSRSIALDRTVSVVWQKVLTQCTALMWISLAGNDFDHDANTESPFSDNAKVIAFQIESLQRGTLSQHSSKALCTFVCIAIFFQIETFQRCTQHQHLCEAVRPATSHVIAPEIQTCQRCALHKHSWKTDCPSILDSSVAEVKGDQRWRQLQQSSDPVSSRSFTSR